ncbi:MAG: response regulator [Methanimicrococcus sp.]|nr:response regulator [Methanimicrococcus sp.]
MKKILLIEDNVMNCELIKDILVLCNYQITSTGDGADALVILENESFDLILTDIHLPKMDGVEFIHKFKESKGIAKVVAMTSDLTTKSGETFEEVGFHGYIQKPFKVSEFRQYIKTMLGES